MVYNRCRYTIKDVIAKKNFTEGPDLPFYHLIRCCRVYCYSVACLVCRVSWQTWVCSVSPGRRWRETSWRPRWWDWPWAWSSSAGRCWWCWGDHSAPTGHHSQSDCSHCGLNNNHLSRSREELINCANITSRWTLFKRVKAPIDIRYSHNLLINSDISSGLDIDLQSLARSWWCSQYLTWSQEMMGAHQHLMIDWSLCGSSAPQFTLFAGVKEAPDSSAVSPWVLRPGQVTVSLRPLRQSAQHTPHLTPPAAHSQLGVGVDAVHAGVVSAGVLVGVGADNARLVRLLENIVQYSTVQYCTVRYEFRFNSTGFRWLRKECIYLTS